MSTAKRVITGGSSEASNFCGEDSIDWRNLSVPDLREEILGRVLDKQIQREAIRGLAFQRPGAGESRFSPGGRLD
jgi:hypothetical protein